VNSSAEESLIEMSKTFGELTGGRQFFSLRSTFARSLQQTSWKPEEL
jgi:hypothetical protein